MHSVRRGARLPCSDYAPDVRHCIHKAAVKQAQPRPREVGVEACAVGAVRLQQQGVGAVQPHQVWAARGSHTRPTLISKQAWHAASGLDSSTRRRRATQAACQATQVAATGAQRRSQQGSGRSARAVQAAAFTPYHMPRFCRPPPHLLGRPGSLAPAPRLCWQPTAGGTGTWRHQTAAPPAAASARGCLRGGKCDAGRQLGWQAGRGRLALRNRASQGQH